MGEVDAVFEGLASLSSLGFKAFSIADASALCACVEDWDKCLLRGNARGASSCSLPGAAGSGFWGLGRALRLRVRDPTVPMFRVGKPQMLIVGPCRVLHVGFRFQGETWT